MVAMNIIDNIRGLFARDKKNTDGHRRLTAHERKILFDLMRQNESMARQDIAAWRSAWQRAVNVDDPQRRLLLNIYRDTDIDLHLSGCVRQRTDYVLSRSFKLSDADGKGNDDATELLNTTWFKALMRLCLESIYWGHSLIELGAPYTDAKGKMQYDGVRLVPRHHVCPEHHRVLRNVGDHWRNGIDYHADPYTEWLIEAGEPDSLGLYLKAATQTIAKRHAMAFWDTFAEIFGMPLRVAKVNTNDQNVIDETTERMEQMGTSGVITMTTDTDIEIVENSKSDSYNVYDRRIDRADKEISKLIIGQTMTIEDGSSLSQSETHLKVFLNLVESDCDMLRDIINNQLLPRMERHGFPVSGLSFEWDYSVDYTPEQQMQYEAMIADRYEVDPQYFAEKYGMPVGAPKQSGGLMAKGPSDFFA